MATSSSINGKDYLDAASDASKRTRSVTITMVVASILILVALINSLDRYQWMLERMHSLGDPQSKYVTLKIGPPPNRKDFPPYKMPQNTALSTYPEAVEEYRQEYQLLYGAVVKSYVDSLSTRVPLFGFSVDACDLGILGGIAFMVILLMYRYSLTREVENMRVARKQARRLGQPREFYDILAMRQVFMTPSAATLKRRRFVIDTPRIICALPLLVHSVVTAHDLITFDVGDEINRLHNIFLVAFELFVTACLIVLTRMASTRLKWLDEVWGNWWEEVKDLEPL